jgi:hypothetical protein
VTRRLSFVLPASVLLAFFGCDWGGDWTDGVWLVDASAPDGGDGKSWATAFQHPQDAVDAASAGDEAWVAGGTYTRRDAADEVVLTMKDGVAIYGGFTGTEAGRGDRDWVTNVTVLDGEDVCEHVVVSASNARLDGFTVERGNTGTAGSGAGIHCVAVVGLDVANCVISNCVTSDFGGALYGEDSSLVLTDVVVVSCLADRGGGPAAATRPWTSCAAASSATRPRPTAAARTSTTLPLSPSTVSSTATAPARWLAACRP